MEQIRRVMRPTDVRCAHLQNQGQTIFALDLQRELRGDPLTALDSRLWVALRFAVVRSRQGHHGLERKRPRCLLHIWA